MRAIDAWHLKRLGELMQVTVKSLWHLKDYDSKEVVIGTLILIIIT